MVVAVGVDDDCAVRRVAGLGVAECTARRRAVVGNDAAVDDDILGATVGVVAGGEVGNCVDRQIHRRRAAAAMTIADRVSESVDAVVVGVRGIDRIAA